MAAKALLYTILFGSLLLPTGRTLAFLLIIAVVGQDITQTSDQQEISESYMASVWQGQLGVLRPSWVFLAYYLGILFKQLQERVRGVDKAVGQAMLFFSTVPFLTGYLYGAFATSHASLEIPADAKLPLFLLSTVFLARNYVISHPTGLGTLASALIGAILARHFIDLAYFALGLGAMWGDVQRVSVDSTKGTVVFVFLLAQFLIFRRRQYLLGFGLTVSSGLLLFVYTTRGLWLSSILGTILFCTMLRPAKMLQACIVIAITLGGLISLIAITRPDNFQLALKRFHSKTVVGSDNFFENQDPARYYQVINSWDATRQRCAYLWGSGYGSYYTESAERFPPELRIDSAFPAHSLISGEFFTLHHFVLKMLFKYGAVGFMLLAAVWGKPAVRCFRLTRGRSLSAPFDLIMPIIAFFPTSMLEISWTTKGMAVSGFTIAVCSGLYDCCMAQAVRHSPREQAKELAKSHELTRAA